MTETEWLTSEDGPAMLHSVRARCGTRKLRLLAAACARSRWSGLAEDVYRTAVEVAERHADGTATDAELARAEGDIWDASWGRLEGDPIANAIADAVTDDFAGNAATRAVAMIPTDTAGVIRDVLGNPFQPPPALSRPPSESATRLARHVYNEMRFEELPGLADLLLAEGCRNDAILDHLKLPSPHFRGCWALDAVLSLGPGPALVSDDRWRLETRPFHMLRWWEYYRGEPTDRQKRLLACSCCRRKWPHLSDDRLRQALETAERYADGRVGVATLREHYAEAESLGKSRVEAMSGVSSYSLNRSTLSIRWAEAWSIISAADPEIRAFGNAIHHSAVDGSHGRDTDDPGQAALIRDVLGSPLRVPVFHEDWRTETAVGIARGIYESRTFGNLPVLADALQDAGCEDATILDHCRESSSHVRGCWVIDLVLGLTP